MAKFDKKSVHFILCKHIMLTFIRNTYQNPTLQTISYFDIHWKSVLSVQVIWILLSSGVMSLIVSGSKIMKWIDCCMNRIYFRKVKDPYIEYSCSKFLKNGQRKLFEITWEAYMLSSWSLIYWYADLRTLPKSIKSSF